MIRTIRISTAVVLILCLAVSPALAWKKDYRAGKKHLKLHAYEQAAASFKAALDDPELEGRSRESVEKYYDEAREEGARESFQRGLRFMRDNDLPKARKAFKKAVEFQPNNQSYKEKYSEVNAEFAEAEKKIQSAFTKAETKHKYAEALKELESYLRYESAFPDIHERITELKRKAVTHYTNKSDMHLTANEYQPAYKAIENALKFSDEDTIKNKKRARHHLLQSHEAWKKNNHLKAYEHIQKGLEFEPKHPELNAFQDRLTSEWAGILYNQAVQANNEGNYGRAKARLTQLSRFKPGFMDSAELLEEVSSTIASTYYDMAEEIMASGDRSRIGTAVAYYLLVKEEHSPLYTDVEDKLAEAKKLLMKELEFRISLDFDNKSGEPGADGLVQEQLLSKMTADKALKNLTILDRDAINDILREQGLGQGFLEESTALEVKKIKGIQAGIKGEVIKVSVRETGRDRPSYGSTRYVSGTRWVPNPDYQMAQADVTAAQQRVLQAQQDYNSAQAQQNQAMQQQSGMNQTAKLFGALAAGMGAISQASVTSAKRDLRDAQSRLARVPPQIEEDIMADYRYEIYNLKLHGEVVMSFKVINYTTSEIGRVHTVRKEEVVEDKYVPGDPSKGVSSDPIDLPTMDEFKNKLLTASIDEMFDELKKELTRSSFSYYTLGHKAEQNKIQDEAVENYMRFIYSAPDLSADEVHEANEYLYQNLGLSVIRRRT